MHPQVPLEPRYPHRPEAGSLQGGGFKLPSPASLLSPSLSSLPPVLSSSLAVPKLCMVPDDTPCELTEALSVSVAISLARSRDPLHLPRVLLARQDRILVLTLLLCSKSLGSGRAVASRGTSDAPGFGVWGLCFGVCVLGFGVQATLKKQVIP